MIKVALIDKTGAQPLKVTSTWLNIQFKAIVAGLKKRDRSTIKDLNSLTVVLVTSKEGRQLNKIHRKKNYATDVLSFAPVEDGSLGELVFCSKIIKNQALEHELIERDELLYLFIHGVLHLLGYDHEKSDKEARVMYRLQDQIFEKLRGQKDVSRNRTLRRKK